MGFTEDQLKLAEQRVGTSLRGKYMLERVLGVGGMAAVFAGTHRNGMRVAIKVLHREVARIAEVKTSFLREGYIANRIDHPGVVRILDDDEDGDGTAFVVMELLDGTTIETEWTRAGKRLPPQTVAAIADKLLDVLDAAHSAGVIHRDIKPDNVFVTTSGEIKVFDFGIARLVDSVSMTKSGEMMGTPEFVAPEQAGGAVRDVDSRSDVFSVGAMMLTLLSGAYTQVARSSVEYLIFAATKPARSIFDVMPDVAGGLGHVIDVALSFDKAQRWAGAREMQIALRSAVGAFSQTERPPPIGLVSSGASVRPEVSGTGTVRMDIPRTIAVPLMRKKE
ncbi:hypothetical protein BH09MYX1_BH09MYX1_45210 [soil metagenome]